MKPKVYIESLVISYLTSKANRDIIIAGRQAITHDWWDNHRERFQLYVSSLVIDEISQGDTKAAKLRLEKVTNIPSFAITDDALEISELLLKNKAVPRGSEEDALHIAIAASQGADYLLTWNFKHINNAETKRLIVKVIESAGFICPLLCSPEELGGSS